MADSIGKQRVEIQDTINELLNTLFQRASNVLVGVKAFPAFGAICMHDGTFEPVISRDIEHAGLGGIASLQSLIEASIEKKSVLGYGICFCDEKERLDLADTSLNIVIVVEVKDDVIRAVIPYVRHQNGAVTFGEPTYQKDRIGILSDF